MKKSGFPEAFPLEKDDRTEDEISQSKLLKKKGKVPMDTGYSEDLENTTDRIRFNLNFDKKVRGIETDKDEDTRKFDIKSLFAAASSGDVTKLEGLDQYLHRTMKHLTDSLYKPNGKTALLKALLNLKDGRNETVEFLLDIAEKMGDLKDFVNAALTDSYYKGQAALHVAIERRSIHYVKLLVEKGADVHAKACGKFFQPHDGPCFYFGELPLSLAACTNVIEIVDFLMENPYQPANVGEQDSHGNTVLHSLVVIADNSPENTNFVVKMYDHILIKATKLHPDVKLEDIQNNQGLTPLKLAAKTGKIALFRHMIKREFLECRHLSRKFTEWVYGPVHSSLYDLALLDTYEKNSVLEIIVYGSDIPNRHEMLQIEPLNKLLEDKWHRFARWIFLFDLIVYFSYLIILTLVAYYREEGQPPFPLERSTQGYLRLTGHLISLVGAAYFFFKGVVDFKKKCPRMQTFLTDGYSEMLFFIQAILFITSTILYFCGRQEYLCFLVICLALSWVNLLYYSRGSKHMGIYSVMIQKMLLGDISRFLLVYVVYLIGFSAAVVTLLEEPTKRGRSLFRSDNVTGCVKPNYNNFYYTTMELFKFTIGMGDLEFTEQYEYKEFFYLLLISYIVLTYILLLNMLIALMNRTVEKLTEESASIWKLQQAITILDLERSVPSCLKGKLRSGVEKELGKPPEEDQRWCFSVEEVNWNKWNSDLGIINEDPGNREVHVSSGPPLSRTSREKSWSRFQSRKQQHREADLEMRPMTCPI